MEFKLNALYKTDGNREKSGRNAYDFNDVGHFCVRWNGSAQYALLQGIGEIVASI